MATDKDGVQIPDVVDAGNYVPLLDNGTNYRPSLVGATAFLGGSQELGEDDGITFKPQGYVPPTNRDGQLGDDIPLTAKKIDAELAVINGVQQSPAVVKPLTQVAADHTLSTDSTTPVESGSDLTAASANSNPTDTAKVAADSNPDHSVMDGTPESQ